MMKVGCTLGILDYGYPLDVLRSLIGKVYHFVGY